MELFLFLMIGIISVILILMLFKNRSQRQRRFFLITFSLLGSLFYLYNWATIILVPKELLTLLPLQLCDLAVFLMPVGFFSKNENFMDFLFYACGLGALSALILMGIPSKDPFYLMNGFFFLSHFAIIALPFIAIHWGFYQPRPSLNKALRLGVILLALTAVMHGLNLWLKQDYGVDAYYFFTIQETGKEVSWLLSFFSKIIPYDYFYMTLTLPILYLYMGLVYLWFKLFKKQIQEKTPK